MRVDRLEVTRPSPTPHPQDMRFTQEVEWRPEQQSRNLKTLVSVDRFKIPRFIRNDKAC